jgi:hypothetical protein
LTDFPRRFLFVPSNRKSKIENGRRGRAGHPPPVTSPINPLPMPHADDVNDQDLVGDHAGDAVVADADSVAVIGAGEVGAAGRPRGAGQRVDRLGDAAAVAAVRPPLACGASTTPSQPGASDAAVKITFTSFNSPPWRCGGRRRSRATGSRRFDLILPALSLRRKRGWAVTHENRGNRGSIPNGAMAQ